MNIAIIKGNLVRDPELVFSKSGVAITKFTVAVARMKKGETDYLQVIAFKEKAELIANSFQKGSAILVEGHIQTSNYTNKEDRKVYVTEIILDKFDFIDRKKKDDVDYTNSMTEKELEDVTQLDDENTPF